MQTTPQSKEALPDEMRPDEAAKYAGIARTYLFALLAHGVLPSRYERGRRLIRREELDKLIAQRAAGKQ
jgi:excisionase family DNA binding protein